MRSYAKSIALYERTKKALAGGVSSNVRYAATPVPLFFERGEGARLSMSTATCTSITCSGTVPPSWDMPPRL